ncbi:hypothetical protein CASFOL_017393 [Castilleja foliolosa]|uniref:Uncharacterized protein n=1 Tax=Castilleja foliolosa TaxID=1961234 RepID=A0ABD3DAY6_9LAMI
MAREGSSTPDDWESANRGGDSASTRSGCFKGVGNRDPFVD